MLQWRRFLPRHRAVPSRAAQAVGADSDHGKEGGPRDCDDVRDSSDAGPGGRRSPSGRGDRARARARREGRRHLAEPRRVGPQAPRVRDRQEAGRRLPPRRVREQRGDARRDLPRAQDRRRGDAPSGDEAHRGLAHECPARRHSAARRGGAGTGRDSAAGPRGGAGAGGRRSDRASRTEHVCGRGGGGPWQQASTGSFS